MLKLLAFCLSFFSPGILKNSYIRLFKIRVFGKSINDVIVFFIPEKTKIGQYDFFLNPKDAMVSGGIALGVYERYETKIFLKSLKPGMTVIDIGAHIGYYTLMAADIASSVLAFEPDPGNFALLEKNVRENYCLNVRCFKLAISDKEEETALYENANNYGDRRIYAFEKANSNVRVLSVTLDSMLEKLNISRVDLVKLDIQGAEGRALAGMERVLNQDRLGLIMEFFPEGLRACGTDPVALLQKLSDKKFKIHNLNGDKKQLELITDFKSFSDKYAGIDYTNLYCIK